MIPPFDLAAAALAVYRVAYLLAREDGPFDLAAALRERLGQATWVGRGFHCPMCLSFWGAFVAYLMLIIGERITDNTLMFLNWGAIAGACAVIHWWRERA